MPLNIVRQDITKMNMDAIVAAEGHNLADHGLVGSAIAEAAGGDYQEACIKLGYCDTGDARITKGYNLPAKYVIHAVGPRYEDGHRGENLLLKSTYEKVLRLAKENNCYSIAFPVISSGGYGFPKKEALKIATDTIEAFLKDNEMDIYLVVYDKETALLSRDLFTEIEEYIDDNYIGEEAINYHCQESPMQIRCRNNILEGLSGSGEDEIFGDVASYRMRKRKTSLKSMPGSLENALKVRDESFHQMLFRLIEEKKLKNSEVYSRANISKSHFSKIKNSEDYKPKKETVFALAVALKLDIDETKELMMKAGYAVSHSFVLDTIVEYFIVNKRYNVTDINIALFDYDQPLLGEKAL